MRVSGFFYDILYSLAQFYNWFVKGGEPYFPENVLKNWPKDMKNWKSTVYKSARVQMIEKILRFDFDFA